MKSPRLIAIPLSGLLWLTVSGARAENWPRFRGPNGSGLGADVTIPAQWTDADFRWRIDLPGMGHGSPVVWGDKLFLLCATEPAPKAKGKAKGKKKAAEAAAASSPDGDATPPAPQRWMPICLSTKDGSILWKQEISEGSFSGHRFNSPASTTPAVDEKRVVFTWGTAEKLTMVAFSHSGEKLWEADLGPVSGGHGFAASPMLLGDLVILNNDQENEKGNLLAVDANTGQVKWTVKRHSQRISYSVPCVISHGGRDLLVFTNWQHGFTVIDPKDGSVVAEKSVFFLETNERAISSPVVYQDLIIGTCGFTANPKQCVAVRLNAQNQLEEVWRIERNVPHIPSLIVVGDRAYLWDDAGIVTCVEAATGKEIWKGRVPGIEGTCMGSPVSDGQTVFCADESGNVHAIAVADELKPLGKNPLGEVCRTTPAFGDGAMFVRTVGKLVAVEGRKSP
ncbi:MAG: PQQ-binding-like beta-propeller repeat protein [Verrucomicrobiae bacterium]|nr:PQQ-binding-like beta-propeller repeat protein [Verrucomicrobiae bacterium]